MNLLVLIPDPFELKYVFYADKNKTQKIEGCLDDYRGVSSSKKALRTIWKMLDEQGVDIEAFDAMAVRIPYGGAHFRHPVCYSEDVDVLLKKLIPDAPLILPPVINFLEVCSAILPGIPVFLFFGTAFFVDLPDRESRYAIDWGQDTVSSMRRYGYHGLFHEHAVASCAKFFDRSELCRSAKIISICLSPRPEICGIVAGRPVMVSGGFTPLEGLPGETTCGEIDPGIVTYLVREKKWGVESVNNCLTKESGIKGLCPRPVSMETLFASSEKEFLTARSIIMHRFLLSIGSAVATMSGVQTVVFSGSYARVGELLGPLLYERLETHGIDVKWTINKKSLSEIIASRVETMLVEESLSCV